MKTLLEYVFSSLSTSPLKLWFRKTTSFLLIIALIYPDLANAMNGEDDEIPSSLISAPLPKDVPLPSRKSADPLESKDRAESPRHSPLGNESDVPLSHSSSPEKSTGSSGSRDESSPHSLGSTPEETSLNDTTNKSSSLGKTPPLLMPVLDSLPISPSSPKVRSLLPEESVVCVFDTLHSLPLIASDDSSRSSDLGEQIATKVLSVFPISSQERHDDDRRDSVLSTSSSPEDVVVTGSMLRIPLPLELQRVGEQKGTGKKPRASSVSMPAAPTERSALLPKKGPRNGHGSIQDTDPMEEEIISFDEGLRGKKEAKAPVVVRAHRGSERNSRKLDVDELFSEVSILRDVTDKSDDVEVGTDILERQALLQKVTTLDPDDPDDRKVLTFLQYAKDRINDGKFTWRQILLGGVGGTLIGTGVGNAMPPIFEGGLDNDKHTWWNRSQSLQTSLIVHTAITLGIDSISRNIMIIGDLAGPSMEEFAIPRPKLKYRKIEIDLRKGSLILVYVGASMAAFLPVYYLWNVEKSSIENTSDPSFRKDTIVFVSCLAPTLFLDALFTNARALKDWADEKLNARRVRQAFGEGVTFSPARLLRQQELARFDDLIRLFRTTPDEDIHDLYEHVLVNGFDIKKNGIDMPEETLKGADALRTLKALRKIHETHEIPAEIEKNWKRKVAKVMGWGIPGIATVGRCLVFYAIMHSLLSDLGANEVANAILSGIFGGGIASLFQGKVEVEAVEQGVYEILHGEDPESDASKSRVWNGARKLGKTYNFVQGIWNTLPYILVGIAATQGWPVAVQIATLLFFGVADAFNNTIAFNESYGGVVTGVESLVSYTGCMTTGYKRNKLIRLVRRYRQAYETMQPSVMMRVDGLMSGESGPAEDHGSLGIPLLISVNSGLFIDRSDSDDSF